MASAATIASVFASLALSAQAAFAEAAPKSGRLQPVNIIPTPDLNETAPKQSQPMLPICKPLDNFLEAHDANQIQNTMQSILDYLRQIGLSTSKDVADIIQHAENSSMESHEFIGTKLNIFFDAYEAAPFEPSQVVMSFVDGYEWIGRFSVLVTGLDEYGTLTYEDSAFLQSHINVLEKYRIFFDQVSPQSACVSLPMQAASPA